MNTFILNSSRSSSRSLLTEAAVYYSTSGPFYLIRATKRAKTPNWYTEGNVKNTNKRQSNKTTAMKDWNFDFFLLFLAWLPSKWTLKRIGLFWWSWRTLFLLFSSFEHVWCDRWGQCLDKTIGYPTKIRRKNTTKWNDTWIISPLFDDLTYNTSRHFAHCSYFFPRPNRARKNTMQIAKYPCLLYFKPSTKVFCCNNVRRISEHQNFRFLLKTMQEALF